MSVQFITLWVLQALTFLLPQGYIARTFHLGVLLPGTGDWEGITPEARAAVEYALDSVNTDPNLSALRAGGHNFTYSMVYTGCKESQGLKALVDLWADRQSPVDAFIGPMCDSVCQAGGLLASEWGLPMISYGCASVILSDKVRYSTFSRTLSPYTKMAPILDVILRHFNWTRVTILASSQGMWVTTADAFQKNLEDSGFHVNLVTLRHISDISLSYNGKRMSTLLPFTRVFIICAHTADTEKVLLDARYHEILNGEYAFLTIGIRQPKTWNNSAKLFNGILDISFYLDTGSERYIKFIDHISRQVRHSDMLYCQEDVHVALLVDAIRLYAIGLQRAVINRTHLDDSRTIAQFLHQDTFTGLQGLTQIDEMGDALSDFTLRNMRNGQMEPVMHYFVKSRRPVWLNRTIMWPGNTTKSLTGEPECGWENEKCHSGFTDVFLVAASEASGDVYPALSDERDRNSVWILIVSFLAAGISLVGLGLLLVKLYRASRKKLELESTAWKIKHCDLQLESLHGSKSQFGSRLSRFTMSSASLPRIIGLYDQYGRPRLGTMTSLEVPATMSIGGKSGFEDYRQQVFTCVGRYQGQLVAIKAIRKPYIYITREIVQELNEVRSMRHPNLNPFLGACVEPNKICAVSLYCSKGSLQDVLENDNIKLDRIFKLSFASDLAQGMVYIHESPLVYHGRLKSSNVLIDSRWTAKVADFGLRKFREGEHIAGDYGEHSYMSQLLWTAPEHLREDETSRTGSQKADVYSFAIILQEIILRSGPFCTASENPKGIVERVKKGEHPPFRPKVMEDEAEEEILDLMRLCWEEIAAFRPNFVTIRDSLRKSNKGRHSNLVDQMMHMMEIYADHLEDIVEERTKQLTEEQKKTEELLCRMLPQTVAQELKMGRTVEPTCYSSVTIFFSDVVGFTALAAASTPLQVVDFLNDLYICFDTVIEIYDVYKVETIGDAYMVASGLPVKNGIRHAGEICTMALDLLSEVGSFRIRHMPDKHLQLRIGVHTGPVVAGVVGLKMPRYCLFGDTVNYASRMESSGLALRVHVSPECKAVLDKLGDFTLEERGEVTMKGKGTITTYFLMGKKGFHKPLPDITTAAPLSEHEFK